MGCSILPEFVCAESIREGRTAEIYPVSDLIAPEPWYACVRSGESARPAIARLLQSFADSPV
jgi:DNA-binding transcriptional LysR family regulator